MDSVCSEDSTLKICFDVKLLSNTFLINVYKRARVRDLEARLLDLAVKAEAVLD